MAIIARRHEPEHVLKRLTLVAIHPPGLGSLYKERIERVGYSLSNGRPVV